MIEGSAVRVEYTDALESGRHMYRYVPYRVLISGQRTDIYVVKVEQETYMVQDIVGRVATFDKSLPDGWKYEPAKDTRLVWNIEWIKAYEDE